MRPAATVSLRSFKLTRPVPMTVSMKFSHSGVAALHRGLDLSLPRPVRAVAGAGLRSVTFTYDSPSRPPSPTPEPPITQTKPCAQSPSSRYDDGAGTLQTHMTVHAAA